MMTTTTMTMRGLVCNSCFKLRPSSSPTPSLCSKNQGFNNERATSIVGCYVGHQLRRRRRRSSSSSSSLVVMCKSLKEATKQQQPGLKDEENRGGDVQQLLLWALEGVYVSWLFLLPYAPGNPVWAIKTQTVNDLVDLSLNFFFILPLANGVGIRVVDAPVLHPVAEGLFNFVIGWTFMFAPLIFTDRRRDRYKGSLEILWTLQMLLTNTLLIPYMAIRLAEVDVTNSPKKPSKFASAMAKGAPIVGVVGAAVCLVSTLWALFGRGDGGFGALVDRWEFFARYIGSERLAYAFIWDICLYIIFQPWLIGDNLQNVEENRVVIGLRLHQNLATLWKGKKPACPFSAQLMKKGAFWMEAWSTHKCTCFPTSDTLE